MLAEPYKFILQLLAGVTLYFLADLSTWAWLFFMEGKFVALPALLLGMFFVWVLEWLDG